MPAGLLLFFPRFLKRKQTGAVLKLMLFAVNNIASLKRPTLIVRTDAEYQIRTVWQRFDLDFAPAWRTFVQ
jgi:hypothetical protein